MNPTCSVVIPTRNCLPYLERALVSVCAQRIEGLEVIVIDDGSTDGTGEWLRRLHMSRVTLRVLDGPARGPARARNVGLAAANAALVAFLDADDLWTPGKLERQIAYHLRHPETVLSFTDYLHVDVDGRSHGTCFEYWRYRPGAAAGFQPIRDAEAVILELNPVGTSTVICRRRDLQIANGFAEDLRSAEDWDLWLRLAAMGPVAATPEVLATYLMHRPGNMTSALGDRLDVLREMANRYCDRRGPAFARARRSLDARVAEAESDLAREAGLIVTPFIGRLKALALRPSLRLAHESALAARDMVGHAWRR